MKKDCNIVKDLLPLYFDDVCSDDSKKFVELHLSNCNECNDYAVELQKNPYVISKEIVQENSQVRSLKNLKSKLFRRNVFVSVTSVLVVIGIFLFVQLYQIPITYRDDLFTVEEAEDGVVDITFVNSDYYSAYVMSREAINIEYVYFTDNIWTKYFTRGKPDELLQFSIGQSITTSHGVKGDTIEIEWQVDYIYYLIEDFRNLKVTDDEYIGLSENAILIWSRDEQ